MHARPREAKDRAHQTGSGELLRRILTALDRAQVRWCLLHGQDMLPEHIAGDIDLVVARDDFSRMFSVLSGVAGAAVAQAFVYEATSVCYVLVGSSAHGLTRVSLDVSFEYRGAGRCFFSADEILINRRRSPSGLWMPAAHMEFATYFLKKVLKSKGEREPLTSGAMTRLYRLFAAERAEAVWALRMFFSADIAQRVAAWIQAGEWVTVVANMALLRRDALQQALRLQPLSVVRYWLWELHRILYRVAQPTGLVIAILGVDGAGKSSVAAHLPEHMVSLCQRARAFHYRPFWGRRARPRPIASNPHQLRPRGAVLSLLKIAYVWLDYWVSWIGVIRPAKVRSTLVVFDRYFDDLYLDPVRYRSAAVAGAARWLARWTPRPDLFVVLEASINQLCQRRPDLSPITAAALHARYAQFAASEPRAIMLANNGRLEHTLREITQCALGFMVLRLQRRLGMRLDGD